MDRGGSAQRSRAAAVGGALLALAGLHPVGPALLEGALLGHPESDMPDHLQGMEWVSRSLAEGRAPWRAGWMFWPDDPVLWFPDLTGAALFSALRPLGVAAAYNLVVALPVMLTAGLMAGLAARRTGSVWAGLAAALIVGPSAFTRGAVHSGLTELLGQWTLVLLLGLLTGRRAGAGLGLGVAALVGIALVQSPYLGLSAAVLTGALAVGGIGAPGGLRRLGAAIAGVGGGLLLAAPVLGLAATTLDHPAAAVDPSAAPGWAARLPAVDLISFVHPSAVYPDLAARGNLGILHAQHLGLVGLGLACWALFTSPSAGRWRASLALLALVLAGPRLVVGDRPVELLGHAVLLPMATLMEPGAPLSALHHPYRLVMAAMPALALLAAFSVARLPRWARPILLLGLLAELAYGTPAPFPVPTTPLRPAPVYAALGEGGAVLDWPPEATRLNRVYKLQQAIHGHPIPYGVNVYLPEALRRDPLLRRLARAYRGPVGMRATNRGQRPQADPWKLGPAAPLPASALPAWVVLHVSDVDPEEAARASAALTEALGPPAWGDETHTAWRWGSPAGGPAAGAGRGSLP